MESFKPGHCLLFLLLILTSLADTEGQKSGNWDLCHCKWATWHPWTACTRNCWGVQIRRRQVWKKNTPLCSGFEICDQGNGALGLRRCNKKCTHGKWDRKLHKCVCPPGLYGVCCQQSKKTCTLVHRQTDMFSFPLFYRSKSGG